MKYTVYMHISPSNKRYIGITSTKVEKRWNNGRGYKRNKYFFNAIKKYGWSNFQHIIIAKGLSEEEAKWLEIELIREWNTTNREMGYNITFGGESSNGLIYTEDIKKKMSKNRKGKCYGKDNHMAKSVVLLNTNEVFLTIKEGAEKYNTYTSNIIKCCRGEIKNAGKLEDETPLVWLYYDEYLQTTEQEIQRKIEEANVKIICITTNEVFLTITEGAKKYNISKGNISSCCNNKRKSAGKHPVTGEKLIWAYYKD